VSVQAASDTAQDPASGSRLDGGTQLVGLRWWPTAGEAVAFVAPMSAWVRDAADDDGQDEQDEPEDPDERARKDLENRRRAASRAKGQLRRYVVANGCTRMLTLTFAPEAPPESSPGGWAGGGPPVRAEAVHAAGGDGRCTVCGRPHGDAGLAYAMKAAAGFLRKLRGHLGVDRLPYALVPEFHKDDHVHVHVLLSSWVEKRAAAELWGRGFVDLRKFRQDGAGGREAARKAAAYASKYVAKALARGGDGRHRYEVAQGFQPAVVKRGGYRSLAAAIDFVTDHGQRVVYAIHSDAVDEYDGPPFLWVQLETSA
jgi:hypothetical protein